MRARYGISDPDSLRDATWIAGRAAIGYAIVTFIAVTAVDSGFEARLPAIFAMICGYTFGGVALIAAGRLKLISRDQSRHPLQWAAGAAMSCIGCMLFLFGSTSFLALGAIILAS